MPHAIAVSSGTAALHLAIHALGIGPGDEVIVPSFTFIAVANAVRYESATPVFVDIDPATLNMDPASVEAAISSRTRAIIIVHNFGVPAEMEALMALARRHHLFVIEDACEAIGATYKNQHVGSFGDISVFAFYPNKQITTGEGGAILTRDSQLADRMRALRNQGRYPSGDWLQHAELGYNYRLSEMACALGIVQLSRLDQILVERQSVAERYDKLLVLNPLIERPPLQIKHRTISWFVYVLRLSSSLPIGTRDILLDIMIKQGIACARYFAPIHLQPAYQSLHQAQHAILPVTESISQRTLALPFFNRLSEDDAESVVSSLTSAIAEVSAGQKE